MAEPEITTAQKHTFVLSYLLYIVVAFILGTIALRSWEQKQRLAAGMKDVPLKKMDARPPARV